MQETPAWAIIVHLFGAAVFLGASFGSLVIVMRGSLTGVVLKRLHKFELVAMYAVIVQILVGGYLFSLEPSNFGKSPVFAIKMLVLIAAGALSGMLAKKLKAVPLNSADSMDAQLTQSIKRFTVAVFASAVTIVVLGFALAATA